MPRKTLKPRPNLGKFIVAETPKLGKREIPTCDKVTHAMVEKVFLKRYDKKDPMIQHQSESWSLAELKNAIVWSFYKDESPNI